MCKCSFWLAKEGPAKKCTNDANYGVVITFPLLDEDVIRDMPFPFVRLCEEHKKYIEPKAIEHFRQRYYKKLIACLVFESGHLCDLSEMTINFMSFTDLDKKFPGSVDQLKKVEKNAAQFAQEFARELH